MTSWVRCKWQDRVRLGILDGDGVRIHDGELFDEPVASGETARLDEVELLAPLEPHSILALWNNFHQRAEAEGQTIPSTPLYFMKPATSVIGPGETIYRPRGHSGRVIFEAELGIVIGRECRDLDAAEADEVIFGYTCVNDVTAIEFLFEDKAFQQWTRSKGFDTFTPLGPVINTDIDPAPLRVLAVQDGETRQDYPVSDMIYSPQQIVAMLSGYQTLVPGDLICCGTSVGARTMKPGCEIVVSIPGIGELANPFADYPD
ncbi:MAG TPA: fumarylacetoacetate hydrolase family protein [Gammaproteobacteria bacterium]|nr:fumarylacetoacetate hydrolase family protein [Gammaproteobacteria bacterium]